MQLKMNMKVYIRSYKMMRSSSEELGGTTATERGSSYNNNSSKTCKTLQKANIKQKLKVVVWKGFNNALPVIVQILCIFFIPI